METSNRHFAEIPITEYISAFTKYHAVRILVLTNLIPIFGVIFFGWQIKQIFFSFWLETLIFIFFSALKIYKSNGDLYYEQEQGSRMFRLPSIARFVGFNLFISFIYLQGILSNFSPEEHIIASFADIGYLLLFIGSLCVSYYVSYKNNFIDNKAYVYATEGTLMSAVWYRTYILHMALWAGGFLIVLSNNTYPYLISLVVLKTCYDIAAFMQEKEHKYFVE